MATPVTFYRPPPSGEEIITRLESEIRRRRETTPEPEFLHPYVENSYKWLCEIEHNRFLPCQVEQLRTDISSPYYWKVEAQTLLDMFVESSSALEKQSTAEVWRKIAMEYRRQLQQRGVSPDQLMKRRLAIEDQKYWEPEATQLREIASSREAKRLAKPAQMLDAIGNPKATSPVTDRGNAQKKQRGKTKAVIPHGRASSQQSGIPLSDRLLRSSRNFRVVKPGGKHGR